MGTQKNAVSDSKHGKPRNISEKSGRPHSLDAAKLRELLSVYYTYPYSYRELADMFKVSRMTVWRAVQTTEVFIAAR